MIGCNLGIDVVVVVVVAIVIVRSNGCSYCFGPRCFLVATASVVVLCNGFNHHQRRYFVVVIVLAWHHRCVVGQLPPLRGPAVECEGDFCVSKGAGDPTKGHERRVVAKGKDLNECGVREHRERFVVLVLVLVLVFGFDFGIRARASYCHSFWTRKCGIASVRVLFLCGIMIAPCLFRWRTGTGTGKLWSDFLSPALAAETEPRQQSPGLFTGDSSMGAFAIVGMGLGFHGGGSFVARRDGSVRVRVRIRIPIGVAGVITMRAAAAVVAVVVAVAVAATATATATAAGVGVACLESRKRPRRTTTHFAVFH